MLVILSGGTTLARVSPSKMVFYFCALLLFSGISPAQTPVLQLTAEETAWIREHPTVRLGVDPAWPPFSFIGKDGQHQGIDAEILNLVSARTGLVFELVPTTSWPETEASAFQHRVDIVPGTAATAERAKHLSFTRPYLSTPVAVIMKRDAPFWVGLHSLAGRRIAAPKGYVTTGYLAEHFPELVLVPTEDVGSALELVAKGGADAVVANLVATSHLIKTRGLRNLKIAGLADERFDLRLAVRNDQPELVAILDKALATITEREQFAITDRWISVDFEGAIHWQFVRRIGTWVLLVGGGILSAGIWWNRRLSRELVERRKVEAALRETQEHLRSANASMRTLANDRWMLLNTVAHDLNNPLSALTSGCGLLSMQIPESNSGAHKDLENMRQATERMRKLIQDLLSAEAIERGERRLTSEPFALSAIVAPIIEQQRPLAAAKEITLDFSDGTGAGTMLRGDGLALGQIVENLCVNAIKFTPPCGRVEVSLGADAEAVHLSVSDSGPGVLQEERTRLFQKFSRLSARPTAGESSNGLGLAIVKLLVTAMNGHVQYDDAPGGGAKFTVSFARIE